MEDDGAQRGASLATFYIELHGCKHTASMERNRRGEGYQLVLDLQRCARNFFSTRLGVHRCIYSRPAGRLVEAEPWSRSGMDEYFQSTAHFDHLFRITPTARWH